jgi:hypothetical protein
VLDAMRARRDVDPARIGLVGLDGASFSAARAHRRAPAGSATRWRGHDPARRRRGLAALARPGAELFDRLQGPKQLVPVGLLDAAIAESVG